MEHEGERTCTTITLLRMSIPPILMTIFPAFMMITLLTTILALIWNLFAIIILMTYTQLSSLT